MRSECAPSSHVCRTSPAASSLALAGGASQIATDMTELRQTEQPGASEPEVTLPVSVHQPGEWHTAPTSSGLTLQVPAASVDAASSQREDMMTVAGDMLESGETSAGGAFQPAAELLNQQVHELHAALKRSEEDDT